MVRKPHPRTIRELKNGTIMPFYIQDKRYAKDREQYIRAFEFIQKDLLDLFDYIEPSDINLKTYSFRVHQLLIRTCIEFEANCKAIFTENHYEKKNSEGNTLYWNMKDYNKLEATHMLSGYEVKLPYWRGEQMTRIPFKTWNNSSRPNPDWYAAYNNSKHDRHISFENANFNNLIDAVCGLLIIISSQFGVDDFKPRDENFVGTGIIESSDKMQNAIGNYFRIKFPNTPDDLKYDFDEHEWQVMQTQNMPYEKIDYTKIK